MTIVIDGETPSKKNQRIINTRTGRSFPSKRYSEWHKHARTDVIGQAFIQAEKSGFGLPVMEPCRIHMTFTHGDLRRRDSDNGTSSVLDLLTDCGVLQDDNWQIVREIVVKNEYEKSNAKCIVYIELI